MKPHFITLVLTILLLACPRPSTGMESNECLGCHGFAEIVGEDLFIDQAEFDHTAHAEMGCTACHDSITDNHPGGDLPASRAGCRNCHFDIGAEYAESAHSTNAACGDCHNPHSVQGAEEVSGHDMNRKCTSCHEAPEMVTYHADWLPQADLHLSMLPCISCHTASPDCIIALYIIKRESDPTEGDFNPATYEDLKELSGEEDFQSLVDTNGDDYISLAELRLFNRNPAYRSVRLQGMMTPETVTHKVQILDNRWDCTFCHASGPEAMQTSFLAVPESNGTYQRLPVEKGAVLDALYGTPDFYMVGATRNAGLSYIGLAIIAGGLIMPVGHGFLRFLTRKNRTRKEQSS